MTGPALELGRIVNHGMFNREQWRPAIHAQPGTVFLPGSALIADELAILPAIPVPNMGIIHSIAINTTGSFPEVG